MKVEAASSGKEIEQTTELVTHRAEELDRTIIEQNQRLESISNLQAEDARQMLIDNMVAKAREEATETIHQIHEEAELKANITNEDDVVEIEPEKICMTSFKSKVSPTKDITLNVAISESAEEICSQEQMKSRHATTIMETSGRSLNY